MVSDFNQMREKLQQTNADRNHVKERYNEIVLNHKQEKELINKLIETQKKRITELEEQHKAIKDDFDQQRESTSLTDQQKIDLMKQIKQER